MEKEVTGRKNVRKEEDKGCGVVGEGKEKEIKKWKRRTVSRRGCLVWCGIVGRKAESLREDREGAGRVWKGKISWGRLYIFRQGGNSSSTNNSSGRSKSSNCCSSGSGSSI